MTEEFVLTESPEIPDLEPFPDQTELPAEVAKVEVVTTKMTDDEGNPVKQVSFTFDLPGHTVPGKDGGTLTRRVYGKTSTTFTTSDRCRLRAWVNEIMAVDELPPGYRLNLEDLVGHPVRVIVKVKEFEDKRAPINADGTRPKRRINEVQDVLRQARQFDAPLASSFADEEPF